MAKIVLEVDNKNRDVVLMILKNLKSDLIKNISFDNKTTSNQTKKAAILEDEFLPKVPQSTGKYLSKEAFKAKLYTNKNS